MGWWWFKTTYKFKKLIKQLPHRALTNIDLLKYAKSLKIKHFRGVYMRNDLPKAGPKKNESAIINLDQKDGFGTHWVAYRKNDDIVNYFDSFGNLQPPYELMEYFDAGSNNIKIMYNRERYQNFDSFNCGHLCLNFLINKNN